MWSYTSIVVLCLIIASWSQTVYGAVPLFLIPSTAGSTQISVDESTPPGTSVYTVSANDSDGGMLTYAIVSQSPSNKFQLNAAILSTNAALDYENETSYVIEIQAVTDSTTETSTATLTVNIADINDETPVITGMFTGSVDEEMPVGTVAAGPFNVTDADAGDIFSYTLSGSTKFQIDSSTLEIKTAEVIDYEAGTTSFSVTLTVSDSATTPHSTSQAITITLNNVNDNTPTFSSTAYFFSVAENSPQATSVAQLTATDGDVGDAITVAIQSGDDAIPKFVINNQLIETTSNAIDYDSLAAQNFMYTLVVSATDGTNTETTSVYVSITGINEHAPVFGNFTPAYTNATTPYQIFENSAVGTPIVTVAASDDDAGTDGEITYSLGQITSSGGGATTGLFHLDQVTGDLTTTSNSLDRDTATGGVEYYDVLIRAVDKGTPSQTVQRTVRVGLTDYNDNAPTFSSSIYTLTIAETASIGSVFTLTGSDHDETSTLTYSLLATSTPSSYSTHFELDTTITNQVNLKAAINLDPADSHDSSYSLVITVTDGGTPELTGTTTLAVTVTSVNEDPPTFGSTTASTSISEKAAVDSQVFKMDASDNDGGSDGTITYSIVGGNTNNKFNIDSSQGAVKVASSLDFETTDQYVLLIEAKDGGSNPLSSTGTLTINITDVSDELPSCTTNAFAVTITEPGTVGTPDIVTLSCDDDDAVDTLAYSISSGNAAGIFSISNTGSITLANNVDYDSSTQNYALTVQVTDGTNTLEIPVNVQVDPSNEDTPAFGADLDVSFVENIPTSTTIATHVATDDDYFPHDIQEYQISSVTNSGGNLFNIDKTSGVIKLAQPFDYESLATKSYIITVLAIDGGSLTGTGSVTVTVTDVNDVRPSCSPASHVISVAENTAINTDIIADFSCTDADSMNLTYTITSQSPSADFSVDTTGTPKLVLSSLLDYETNSAYEIVVSVSDGSFTTSVNIDVSVTDINDGGPTFAAAAYTTSLAESVAVGTSVIQITATDPDSSTSSFGNLLYSFISGNGDSKFLINPSSGVVSTAGVLNAETTNSYSLVVQAIEEAGTNSATATFNVTVSSVNDNSPTCTSGLTFSVSFAEEGTTGDTVHTLLCTDADGDALTYTMTTGDTTFFVMNASVLQLNAPVDFDTVVSDQFAIVIQVSDGSNTVDVTGSVTVTAANEHSPAFPSATVNVSVSEAVSPGTLINTNAVTATDVDKDETITYSFITAAGDFTIDQSTGHILVAGTLDRETTDSYTITVQGSDGTNTAQYILNLVITDENDNSPVFNPSTYSVSLSESVMIGTAVVTVAATDADDPATNDYGTVQYSIISGNTGSLFTIGTSSGSITTAGSPNYEATTTYTLIVQAMDSNSAPGALSSTAVVTVNIDPVNDAAPAFLSGTYSVSIPEDTSIGQSILKVSATDTDSGNDGVITYSMVTNTHFYLDTGNGDISVRASLDFEASDSHTFEVVASDSGTSPRSSTTSVTIVVTDVNDNFPICSPNLQTVSFAENTALGTNLATLTCNDADSGVNDDLTFSIQSITPTANIFEVTTAGLVNLINTQFNYESQISYSILIEVSDGGTPTLSTTTTVKVDVTDINEASPSFITTTFTFSISETTAVGMSVFVVSATDTDTANTITYSFNPTSSVFDIDSATGIIYTVATIDYDTLPAPKEYELTVFATDDGTSSQSVTQTVTATILDNNDGTPYFSPAVYSAVLAEDAAQGTTVATVTATDIDDASVTYSLANNFGILRIEASGDLILDTASQNYETTKSYLVVVYAVDGNTNSGTATVHIEVTGVNEHDPSLTPPSSALNLAENLAIGTTIVTVVANDSDDGVDGILTYSLSSIPVGYEGDFAINPSTGEITLAGTIDMETVSNPLVIKALATDGGTPARSAEFTLTLTITDENDNRPSCSPSLYSVSVAENIAVSTSIAQLTCVDSDKDAPNNELTFSITSGNTGSQFEIDSITGEIRTSGTASLNRETLDNYQLLVEVADNASASLTTTATLTVTVTDVNDNTPAFAQTSYTFNQFEDVAIGTTVGTVVATDNDISDAGTVVYSIFSGNTDSNLAIDSNTGDIRLIAALDYERETQYNLIVYAIDKEATFRTGSTTVTFMVTDTNDVKPNCTDALQTVQFAEDTLTATVTIATVTCTDTDTGTGGTVVYTISTVDGVATTTPFSIDSNTGVITLANKLDYESDTLKQIVVFGIDGGTPALTGTATINVVVTDVNEEGPVFQSTPYTVSLSENTSIGQSVYIIAATDADTSDTITYSFDPTSSVFEIDSSTGEVYLRGNLDFEGTRTYTLTVVATDDGTSPSSKSSTGTITITVTNSDDGTPIFSPAVYVGSVSENDNVGTTVTTVTATDIDGTTPTYSIISGNAASVFRIEASGAIAIDSVSNLDYDSGTQSYTLVVQASDGTNTGTTTVAIAVTNYNDFPPVLMPSGSTETVAEDSAVGTSVVTVVATDADLGTDGNITYSITSGNTAGKFSINPSTGTVTLAATLDMESVTTYTLNIDATDAGTSPSALSAQYSLTVTVTDANDVTPVCTSSLYSVTLAENSVAGTSVAQLTCSDGDVSPPNNDISQYFISSGNTGGSFAISTTGEVTVVNSPDRESLDSFVLVIHVIDGGTPALTFTTTLAILITDLNDNSPSFSANPYGFNSDEDTSVGAVIGTIMATDADSGSAGTISYTLNAGNVDSKFEIDSSTGELKLSSSLDFETATNNPYVLEILGADNDGSSPLTATTTVSVTINDKNDNTPACTPAVQAVEFAEDTAGSTMIASITCTDADSAPNSGLLYEIVSVNGAVSTLFEIDGSGVLTTAAMTTFDFETTSSYNVLIRTKDSGTPSLSFTSTVNVVITDVNEVAPVFQSTPYTTNVAETTAVGTSVYVVTALDNDTANTVTYTVNPSNTYFEIDPSTGIVRTIAAIDYDTITPKNISVTLVATDNGSPSQSVTETLVVTITDANDETPMFNPAFYSVSVAENETIGTTFVSVTATDVDDVSLTYSIASGNVGNVFRVDAALGALILDDITNFDYDSATKSYTLVVRAVDAAPNTASTTVVIEVTSINDNPPHLAILSSTQNLAENTAVGTTVIDIDATDADHGNDGVITYSIASVTNNGTGKFSVDPTTGIVTVSGNIDRETVTSYVLNIEAADGGTVAQTATYTLTVDITDENDNTPRCTQTIYSASVSESSAVSTSVAQLTCSDSDATPPNNDIASYSVTSGNTGIAFTVSVSGEITVNAMLDRETLDSYQLVIEVADSGATPLTTTTTLTIIITDENDNEASFTTDPYNFNQLESISVGTIVGSVSATDADSENNGAVTYSIASGDVDTKFQIDSSTGDITVKAELDFETASVNPYTLVINALDGSGSPKTATTSVIVAFTDVNDNTPICTPVLQTISFAEDTTTPTTLANLVCNDSDTGNNAALSYTITQVNGVGTTTLFAVDTSGALRLTNSLNYESETFHVIIVEVADGGTPSLTATVTVNVQVTDINDNTPVFSGLPYNKNVNETTSVGTSVFKVTAADADTADTITFSVNPVSTNFDVDPSTGDIFLKAAVDFEAIPTQYEVIVVATDDGTSPGANSASATVTLDITNFNDGIPEFNPGFYAVSVRENATALTSILTVTISDIDDTVFTFNIISGNTGNIFGIAGTTTNAVISVDDPTNLDFETTQAYTLVIRVTDGGGNTGSATVEISITNYNEHVPSLVASSSTPSIAENSGTGTSVVQVNATDADSGTDGDISYSIISGSNGKFAIDPSSGLLTVSGTLDKETLDSYTVVIHAVDAGVYPGALTATYSAVVTITDVNDFSPVCSSSLYSATLAEDSPIGTTVGQLTCTDADSDSPNKDINTYIITSGNAGGEYSISNSGEITTTVTFDRENTDSYQLVILVTDMGTIPSALSTTTTMTVSISDVNDNDPVFAQTVYNINIDESTAIHTSIGKVGATDADIDLAGLVLYSIASGNTAGKFALDKSTGDITLVGELDYETTTTTPYVLIVHAIDREATFRTGTATVSVTINDINDNEPTCTASLYTGTVAEDATTSTSVATVACTDIDTVGNTLTYSILSNSPEFIIATVTSGEITTASSLDYESATSHDLTVQVTDGAFSVNVSVQITVTNINDEPPAFNPAGPYTASIDENVSIGTTVYDVNATDADATGTLFVFSITSGNGNGKFTIGTFSGIIQVQQTIDRDDPLITSYTLGIEVADQTGAGALTASTSIVISITDINDNYPSCDSAEYFVTLLEDTTVANVITPTCTDLDVVASPTLLYTITAGNTEGKFQIGTGTGILSRIGALDYETTTRYTLTVTVDDQGTPALVTTVAMTIYVDPVNEDTPVFQGKPYDTDIDENVANGYIVLTVSATDSDTGSTHGTVRYSVTSGNSAGHFSLNPTTGVLTVAANLDRETTPSYTLTVAAMDMIAGDTDAKTVTDTFTITISDVNDNYPQISPPSYTASLNEHVSGTLTPVLQITATDDDEGNAGTAGLNYSIIAGNTLNVFQMNGNTLELSGNIDANTQSIYTLTVKVADQGTPVLSAFTSVIVQVVATNDHAPTFTTSGDTVTISESETIGNSIYQAAASDSDTGMFAILRYYLRAGVTANSEEFTVDKFDGTVRVATKLDYDTAPTTYTLRIEVEDTENSEANTQTATTTLTVSLTDFNDETPTCTSNTFTGNIDENSSTGTSVVQVIATDSDSGLNGQITYSIVGGSGSSSFGIDSTTGDVSTTAAIDYETVTLFDLEIEVKDGGTPTLSSSCLVRITVIDLNDNKPVLLSSSFAITVLENIPINTIIDTVQATDADSTANNNNIINFSFSVISAFFSIGSSTGILRTSALLDRETLSSHTLVIYAADQGTLAQNTATTTYTIVLSDFNDNAPTVSNAPYDTTVSEDSAVNTVVHTLTVTDVDEGENAVLNYTITNGNTDNDFRIDSSSGLIQVFNTLDRERKPLYNLEVTVTDGGTPQQSVVLTATVSIGDVNDNSPVFQPDPTTTYSFSVEENVPSGTVVNSVSASDADTGTNAIVTYVVVNYITGDNTHFSVNTATGEITTAGNLDRETQDTYVFIVRAMDAGSSTLTATATVSITITDTNDNIPSFGSSLYTATVVENSAIDTSILSVVFSDIDILVNDDIVLSIDTSTAEGTRANTYIYPNSTTAVLYVQQLMDRETDEFFNFTLIATDQGTPPLSFSTSVVITVGDANDNAPIFSPTFYNSEIAYNDDCQVTVTTITAADADIGVNAVIEYYTTLNNNPHLFTLSSGTGVVSMVANAAANTGYLMYAAARDSGSPQQNSSTGATIRIDTYNPSDVILNYYMNINVASYLAIETTFLTQLTTVYQTTYPTAQAKRWCVVAVSSTSCVVRIYVIKDDTANEESETANAKNFLTADEAYAVTAADDAGTPASAITEENIVKKGENAGISWTQFAITRVEKYSDPDSDSKPWIETAAGIAVLSVAAVIGVLLIGGLVAYTIWYCRKPASTPPRNRVEVADDDGGDTVAKNQFSSKNNTIMTANDTMNLSYDKKNLPPAVVALPMPSATKRVPLQPGNKTFDKPKDVNLYTTPFPEPVFEKKPEKLRRSSPVPTETVYSPASRYRTDSPFLQPEINYPVKRLPPTHRPPVQRPPRLEDSVSTVPDSKSNVDEGEFLKPKRHFDGRAVDPVTGRVYEYNTKTNERQWVTSSDGSPYKLTRDEI